MDHERFRDWFSRVDELTAAQRKEVAAVLSEPSEGAASLAAIELGVDDERRCAHCGAGGAVSRGKARGLRRFRCKECGKTFGAPTACLYPPVRIRPTNSPAIRPGTRSSRKEARRRIQSRGPGDRR